MACLITSAMLSTASPSSAEPRFIWIEAPGASDSTFHTKNKPRSAYDGEYTVFASAAAQSPHTSPALKPLRKSARGRVGGSVSCAASTNARSVTVPPNFGDAWMAANVPFSPPYAALPGCEMISFCVAYPIPCGCPWSGSMNRPKHSSPVGDAPKLVSVCCHVIPIAPITS